MGDSGVGKTSLLQRFTEGSFEESSAPTIGASGAKFLLGLQVPDHALAVSQVSGKAVILVEPGYLQEWTSA